MHVSLGLGNAERVQHLLHLEHAKGGDIQHLGLATREQRRSVSALHRAGLDGEGPDISRATAVHADARGDRPLTGQLLEDGLEGTLRLCQSVGVILGDLELSEDSIPGFALGGLALLLAGNLEDFGDCG